jgi:hypothetical protein
MNSTKDLITKSNSLIERLGSEAAVAGNATDRTNDFSNAAFNAGNNVAIMGDKISSAYLGLKETADAAVEAYDRMQRAAEASADAAESSVEALASTAEGVADAATSA